MGVLPKEFIPQLFCTLDADAMCLDAIHGICIDDIRLNSLSSSKALLIPALEGMCRMCVRGRVGVG